MTTLLVGFLALCSSASTPITPIPINIAEAIIEPFWAPELSGFDEWVIDPNLDSGLHIKQNWAAVDFEWRKIPDEGPALRMSRDILVNCRNYDELIVRAALPRESILTVIVHTDQGTWHSSSQPSSENRIEHAVDLKGASVIEKITLEIAPGHPHHSAGWLRWIGLRNTALMTLYQRQWDFSSVQWKKHIKDSRYHPTFRPRYGIFLTPAELNQMRAEHEQAVKQGGHSSHTRIRETSLEMVPEKGISEFVNSGGSRSAHSRVRDAMQPKLEGSTKLATAGLVLRDARLLRQAARYALSLAASDHWDTGFMSSLPLSSWEDRAFRRSYTSEDIAVLLDLAGEMFTETGRNYLMRRLAEEGIGPINYVAWRHEYIFHCNQLAYFNTGRMYAYLVLEREWPRIKPYTDLAFVDSVDNLKTVIEPDGGYLEGPSYFNPTVRENCQILKHYARSRGLDYLGIVPEVLQKTADFAAVVISTTADDVIPICDANPGFRKDTLDVLMELMPNSTWSILRKKHQAIDSHDTHQSLRSLPAFVSLPDTGHVASTRCLNDQPVKILVMGHKQGADHTHEDKGSFVLEFAGETFAADFGICDYDDPVHVVYKQCQRHNMLVPIGTDVRAHPDRPLLVDVKPSAQGDEVRFQATINATPGWHPFYRKWIRHWDSPTPDILTIRDDYELVSGSGVAFYWQTKLPVEQQGDRYVIKGSKGFLTLHASCNHSTVEVLPLAEGDAHNRITWQQNGSSGSMEIQVNLHLR